MGQASRGEAIARERPAPARAGEFANGIRPFFRGCQKRKDPAAAGDDRVQPGRPDRPDRPGRPDLPYRARSFRCYSDPEYLTDLEWFQALTRSFATWMIRGGYDVWLTPTLGAPPPPLGHFDADRWGAAAVLDRFIEFLPFTPLANMTGQPAISLPLSETADGLPVGVQLMSDHFTEPMLLRAARAAEQVADFEFVLKP